jgi:hypothetical protein
VLTRSTSFGPTCRLASSSEEGPTATVSTLKLGYPLLLCKDTVPTWLSPSRVVEVLCVGPSHGSPQSQAAILGPQQRPTHHMGGSKAATCPEKVIYSKASTVVRTPTGERRTPGYTVRTPRLVLDLHVCKPDPWNGIRTPPVWGPGRPQWGPKVQGQNMPEP